MQGLSIVICKDAQDAIVKGYDYAHRPEADRPVPLVLERAVVVRKGMQSGASSVDLIFRDPDGKEYVALIPSRLLASIPAFED